MAQAAGRYKLYHLCMTKTPLVLSLSLCAFALMSGIVPARAQDRRPGDHDWHDGGRQEGDRRDGDRRDDDGWTLQYGDPADAGCTTWEFTAQTPNTKTDKLITAGSECRLFPDDQGVMRNYCRSTGKYATKNVTVNIGSRALQPWEKEELKVCLDQYGTATVDTTAMLYAYTVASQDRSVFLGTDQTIFTLTPGAKKPSVASSDEISVQSAGAAGLVLADKRADYYKGEKISFSVSVMLLPTITPDMKPEDIIKAFLNFTVAKTFDTAPTYNIPIAAANRPGTYVVTINFTRQGPLSSADAVSTTTQFTLP
jgi:hypothetical protein